MNYLEELKKRVAAAFENATGKEDIDNLSSINTTIGLVEQEQNQLMAKNKELIAAYKEAVENGTDCFGGAVLHPGISKQAAKEPTDVPPVQQAPDFAAFVAQELSK